MANETIRHEDGGSMVAIIAIVILAGLAILFFVYGLPLLQGSNDTQSDANIDVQIPNPITNPSEPAPTPNP